MEDTLSPTSERKKIMKSKWGYSWIVTVGNFLTNLFRNPEITLSPDCPPTVDENPMFESLPKPERGLST